MKPADSVFKFAPQRSETKDEITTRVAREIIASDAAATAAKTERLRAARLLREVDEKSAAAPSKKRKGR